MKIIITRRIPDELHHDFKVACAKQNISMNKCIIELMKKYVEENNGK
jgi:predicted HicB family RNase H-like nuclease